MTGRSSRSPSKPVSKLQTLSPSAKLVAKALEYEGDLTQAQLVESTLLIYSLETEETDKRN